MTETGIVADENLTLRQPPSCFRERLAHDADSLTISKILLGAGRLANLVRPEEEAHASPSRQLRTRQRGESLVRPTFGFVSFPSHRTGVDPKRAGNPLRAPCSRHPVVEIVFSAAQVAASLPAAGFPQYDDRLAAERERCETCARSRSPRRRTRAWPACAHRHRERSVCTASALPEKAKR